MESPMMAVDGGTVAEYEEAQMVIGYPCGVLAAQRAEDPSEWHRTASLSSLRRTKEPAGRDVLLPDVGCSGAAKRGTTASAARVEAPADVPEWVLRREEPAHVELLAPTPWTAAEINSGSGHHTCSTAGERRRVAGWFCMPSCPRSPARTRAVEWSSML